jgi:hypothetical protein
MNTFEEHSPENPTNWIDRLEVFESDDLSQCLDYAKETQDFEPLENSIFMQETKVKKAMEKIVFSLDAMAHSENTFIINQLLAIKRELI